MRRSFRRATATACAGAIIVALPAAGRTQQQAPPDTTRPEVSISFSSTQLESRLLAGGVRFGLAADENVDIAARVALGGRTFGEGDVIASGRSRLEDGPGKTLVTLALTDRGKERIRRPGTELLVLNVVATDEAGNRAVIADRLSRTQSLAQRRGGSVPPVIFSSRTILGPGTRIPIDFPGYREPDDDRLPANHRVVRYRVRAVRGEEAAITLFAPAGFRIVSLGVAQDSEVVPRPRDRRYPGMRAVRVTLAVDRNRVEPGATATGTIYLLARRP
jgi:hypothetical protein